MDAASPSVELATMFRVPIRSAIAPSSGTRSAKPVLARVKQKKLPQGRRNSDVERMQVSQPTTQVR